MGIPGDVADRGQCARLVEETVRRLGVWTGWCARRGWGTFRFQVDVNPGGDACGHERLIAFLCKRCGGAGVRS